LWKNRFINKPTNIPIVYLKRILRGSVYYFIGAVIANAVAYLIRLYLLHNLSVNEFGLFYAVFNFIAIFLVFRNMGLTGALTKYIAEYEAKGEKGKIKSAIVATVSIQMAGSLLLAGILWLLAPSLATNLFKDPQALMVLRVLVFYIPLTVFYYVLLGFFRGFQKTHILASLESIKSIVMLIFIVLFASLGLGIFAPVWAYLLVYVVLVILFVYPLLKTYNIFSNHILDFKGVAVAMVAFGFPSLLSSFGSRFISYFDTLMLTYFSTLEQVGIYNIVLPTALVFMMLSGAVGAIFMPLISELWAKNKKKKITEALDLLYKYIFLVGFPIILSVFVFSDVFIRMFFGQEFLSGDIAFKILLVGALFNILASLNHQYLGGIGKPKKVMKIMLIATGVNIMMNLVLIPTLGITGAAIATSASYLCMLVISMSIIKRTIKIRLPIRSWLVTLVSSAVFLSVVYLLKYLLDVNVWLKSGIALSAGYATYLLITYLFKEVDIDQIKMLLGQLF
jgi:stage V sporulation protein B